MAIDRIVLRPTATDPSVRSATVQHAVRRGFRRFAGPATGEFPDGSERVIVLDDRLEPVGRPAIPRRRVGSPAELEAALALGRSSGAVALEFAQDRVIPLESAVAGRAGHFELWVVAARPSDVPGFLGALEHGADSVVVDVDSPHAVDELESLLDARPGRPIAWSEATVVRIRPVGLADRVLLDATSLLRPSEGFAIGSRAGTLFLVLSEAEGSTFSRPRPFRVNAGAAHSYLLMADGSTRYLSEVEPGEEIVAIDRRGETRGVRLGRRKVERRPTVLVEAELEGTRATVFLQEAETVRLATGDAGVAVTELAVGAKVLAVALAPARHLGEPVAESIEER